MWKPSTARTARIVVGLALIGLLTGCGSRTSNDVRTAGSYDELDVMPLSPEVGKGMPTEVLGVRILEDGSTQAMVSVGHCSVPTRLNVTQTSTTVELAAYQRDLTDDACPMIAELVFVPLELPGGWRGREVVDAFTKQPGRVVDCATDLLAGWCIGWEGYDVSKDPYLKDHDLPRKKGECAVERRARPCQPVARQGHPTPPPLLAR